MDFKSVCWNQLSGKYLLWDLFGKIYKILQFSWEATTGLGK